MTVIDRTPPAIDEEQFDVARVAAEDLEIDTSVQRVEGINKRRVREMAAVFDPEAIGVITVSARDTGKFIVLDGMTRTTAAKLAGYKGKFTARVFFGLSRRREHELFLLLNETYKVSALTIFTQKVAASTPPHTEISKILASHGWTVQPGSNDGYFRAVRGIEKVYDDGGAELVDWVMAIITKAWGHNAKAANATIIKALGRFKSRYGEKVQNPKLVAALQSIHPIELIAQGRTVTGLTGGTIDSGVAAFIASHYNKRLSTNKLPKW